MAAPGRSLPIVLDGTPAPAASAAAAPKSRVVVHACKFSLCLWPRYLTKIVSTAATIKDTKANQKPGTLYIAVSM